MNSQNQPLHRLFRLAAILSAALLAVSVLSWLSTELLVRFVAENPAAYMLTVVKVHNVVQLVADYGLKIAVFAVMIVAAKHFTSQSRANLLKIGGIVGVIGGAFMLAISAMWYVSDPPAVLEDLISIFSAFSTHPLKLIMPHVTGIGMVLCVMSFAFHKSPAVNLTAILRIVCVLLLLSVNVLGVASTIGTMGEYILTLVGHVLSIALYVALTKYYAVNALKTA